VRARRSPEQIAEAVDAVAALVLWPGVWPAAANRRILRNLGRCQMPKRDEVVGEARARVLIADDHPLLRSALRRLLEGAGNQIVAEAADGVAAVRLAFATKPHVALLDIMMPVMGGIEAARQISRGCPDTHVVMMSGYADADRRAAAASVGAEAFIEKGACIRAFIAVIDGIRKRHSRRRSDREVGFDASPEPAAEASEIGRVTAREREVLRLVAEGYSSASIATRLMISVRTVETHRRNVMTKLGLHSATALTRFAVAHGLT
jgi:two-component system nitrate/nitrite response regulator NarL